MHSEHMYMPCMTFQGQQLQRTIRQDDESIKKLKQDLEKTKTDFANMQERHKKEIESLKVMYRSGETRSHISLIFLPATSNMMEKILSFISWPSDHFKLCTLFHDSTVAVIWTKFMAITLPHFGHKKYYVIRYNRKLDFADNTIRVS